MACLPAGSLIGLGASLRDGVGSPVADSFFPPGWSAGGAPTEAPDVLIDAAARLGRSPEVAGRLGFASLLALAHRAPPGHCGSDGTPLLVAVLRGWPACSLGRRGSTPGAWAVHSLAGSSSGVPRFPLPGEPAWDGAGEAFPSELAAAILIWRGADPFAAAADGTTAWELAHAMGAPGLVSQMLRHPACPAPLLWPLVSVEDHSAMGATRKVPALHAAVQANPHLVGLLVAAGASWAQCDAAGEPALWATRHYNGDGARHAVAMLEGGVDPWAPDAAGWLLPERVAFDGCGYCPPRLLAAWSAAALRSLAARPDEARRERFLAAAFHLGRADWLARLPGLPPPASWPALRAPHGVSLLEWAWVGNILRGDIDDARQALAVFSRAPWRDEDFLPGEWVLSSPGERISPSSRVLAGLHAMEALVRRTGVSPMRWVACLWLMSHHSGSAPRDGDPWGVYANALSSAWLAFHPGMGPVPLPDDIEGLSCVIQARLPPGELPAPAFRAAVWSLLGRPGVGEGVDALPVPARGWEEDPDGQLLLEEWPHLAARLSRRDGGHLLPVIEAAFLAVGMRRDVASGGPSRL